MGFVTPWPQEATDLAVKLWGEGKSAREISCALGKRWSRNAVIGKLHRMGLTNIGRGSAAWGNVEKIAKKRQQQRKRAVVFIPNKVITPTKRETLRAELALIACMPPIEPGATVTSLPDARCRYMNGDPQVDATVCGRATTGGAWCASHRKLVYQKAEPKARATRTPQADELRRALKEQKRREAFQTGAAL